MGNSNCRLDPNDFLVLAWAARKSAFPSFFLLYIYFTCYSGFVLNLPCLGRADVH